MNVADHDRQEARRLARLIPDSPVPASDPSALRSPDPRLQGITPTALRKKVHQLGPTASLTRLGQHHYICSIGRSYRFEGFLGEVNEQLQPLFTRFNIS